LNAAVGRGAAHFEEEFAAFFAKLEGIADQNLK
jgi:hypothetical protein